jgi:hypothetical protein
VLQCIVTFCCTAGADQVPGGGTEVFVLIIRNSKGSSGLRGQSVISGLL